jgi:hypothetical protein
VDSAQPLGYGKSLEEVKSSAPIVEGSSEEGQPMC